VAAVPAVLQTGMFSNHW